MLPAIFGPSLCEDPHGERVNGHTADQTSLIVVVFQELLVLLFWVCDFRCVTVREELTTAWCCYREG